MSNKREPTIDTIWRPCCFECDWVGQTRPLRSDASDALDRHLERNHPSILVLLKRNRVLEQIASIAFDLVPDEEALLCEHSDDDVDPIFCEECLDAIVKRHKDELDNATKELATAKRTIAKLYTELVRKEREKNER